MLETGAYRDMSKDFEQEGTTPGQIRSLRCISDNCQCQSFLDAWRCAQSTVLSVVGEEKTTASSRQVGGDHYTSKAVQPWDAMQSWMTAEAFQGFLAGNALKYLARYKDKGGKKDIEKAAHYLQKLLEVM